MDSAKAKYNLDGGLDYSSGYAGLDGYNIKGVEIRIFEENGIEDTPQTPVGQSKFIDDVPHIYQKDPNSYFPSGCESVSAVMVLQYWGSNISVEEFVDIYLDKAPRDNFHPDIAFGGNPRYNDYGCYAPVIKKALDKITVGTNYKAKELHDVPIATLCSEYIDNNIPVIMWATMNMEQWHSKTLYYNGTPFQWIQPEHCLVLIGYDDDFYYFRDPLKTVGVFRYEKSAVEAAYAGLHKQAVVIVHEPTPTEYEYGAIKHPVNNLIYPLYIKKNSSTPSYEENYVTHAESTHYIYREFNLPQFIAGLEFDDSMLGSPYPVQASLVSMFMGGLNSCLNSINSAYIDIDYLIATGSGHRRAIARAGSTTYNEKFKNWDYNLTEQSVKTSLSTFWNGVPAWYGYLQDDVNELFKNTYRALKMIEAMPNPDTVVVRDDVQYDMLVTLDEDRKDAKYSSYIFAGKDGKLYEYVRLFPRDKFQIQVYTGGWDGMWPNVIEKFDITKYFNAITELDPIFAEHINVVK